MLRAGRGDPGQLAVQGYQATPVRLGKGKQMPIGDLVVGRHADPLLFGERGERRSVLPEDMMLEGPKLSSSSAIASGGETAVGITVAFEETRTKPLSVKGEVAQPPD
ncbi:MAG: hypothetical protein ACRDWA_12975 [Acidimicrobiia bacterium]